MINKKIIAGLLSGVILTGTISTPLASAQGNTVNYNLNLESIQNDQKLKEIMKAAILENKEYFNDPAYADVLLNKLDTPSYQDKNEVIVMPFGKFTLTAKAGAQALKVAMDKIGQKAWDGMVKTIEDNFGVKLVVFHWKSMNQLINVLSNSSTTITDAITDFLVDKASFNRTFAEIVARAFVTVFL
ncbi:hypothetical protein [Metasolibacillus meyeri]|uniref:hypothetical protein n=1 Tax=Metasolibacillus meyeri TaxID=1071052 RepID=UPI000D319CE6|nr:hypothetical protein [Metasolibacillus meyeri]